MKKLLISLLVACSASFALTLNDVRKALVATTIAQDSLEMEFKTTLRSPMIGTQSMETYSVRKGPKKIYFEMKSQMLNQRLIVSDKKMKVVDLKTNKETIMKKNEMFDKMMQTPDANPLENGNWKEPVLVSDKLYKIEGDSSVVYYDAGKKQLTKMEQETSDSNTLTTFEYDPTTKKPSAMKISIMSSGKETVLEVTFTKYQKSKDFPDRFFEF